MNSQFEENPWDPPTLTEPTRQQHTLPCLQQSPNRAARRVRAANDPLVSPSRAHINEFETATRKRALKGMLECIDDAISTPMPHSDIRMARVRADVDVTVMGSPVLNGTGLAISLPEDGGVLPLRIPEVPGRQSVDSMSEVSYAKGALSVSEGSTVGHVLMAGQNSRTIKTVKHSVTGEDTLEGISILYGVSICKGWLP
ncbi:hypothetical protein FBU59_000272 [Linderina macrospora]|uniref:Uncharacterized protein n=1 Tax=Linderina macrospora TaxID=4868 RepID=A0ACC1JHB9_9FUNG|nr:hypothetical protein FBU59_000272 [Linderina macrospora]